MRIKNCTGVLLCALPESYPPKVKCCKCDLPVTVDELQKVHQKKFKLGTIKLTILECADCDKQYKGLTRRWKKNRTLVTWYKQLTGQTDSHTCQDD